MMFQVFILAALVTGVLALAKYRADRAAAKARIKNSLIAIRRAEERRDRVVREHEEYIAEIQRKWRRANDQSSTG